MMVHRIKLAWLIPFMKMVNL